VEVAVEEEVVVLVISLVVVACSSPSTFVLGEPLFSSKSFVSEESSLFSDFDGDFEEDFNFFFWWRR